MTSDHRVVLKGDPEGALPRLVDDGHAKIGEVLARGETSVLDPVERPLTADRNEPKATVTPRRPDPPSPLRAGELFGLRT
jgi:hypothetical protein